MKKTSVLNKFTKAPDILKSLKPLVRNHLYYITDSSRYWWASERVPVLLTHFYEYVVRYKVLIHCRLSRDGYYNIAYTKLDHYLIEPMPLEDLPLYTYAANEHMSEGFRKGSKQPESVHL